MAELGRDQIFVTHDALGQPIALCEFGQTIDRLAGYRGVIEWSVAFDEPGDQFRLVGGKQPSADIGRERWICAERLLCFHDGPDRAGRLTAGGRRV